MDQVLEDGEIGASPSQTDESSDPGLADYTDVLQSIQKHNYDNVLEKCSHAIEKGLTATLPNALVLRGTFSLLKMESDDAIRDFTQVLSMGDDKVSSKVGFFINRFESDTKNVSLAMSMLCWVCYVYHAHIATDTVHY